MPIYEYRCGACDQVFEYMQRMSDDPKTTCENCGGDLERLISRSAFHLKGGGWYKDLYSSPKPGAGDSKSSSDSSTAATPKSDSSAGSSSPSSPSSTSSSDKKKAD